MTQRSRQKFVWMLVLLSPLMAILASPVITVHGATFTVNTTSDERDVTPGDGVCRTASNTCSLRAAIQEANANANADTITLPAGNYTLNVPFANSGNYKTSTRDLEVSNPLTIIGAGEGTTTITGVDERVFDVQKYFTNLNTFTFALSGVTITGGNATNTPRLDGGALFAGVNVTVNFTNVTMNGNRSNRYGGAIYNYGDTTGTGTVNLVNCTVTNNASDVGGAIINDIGATMTIAGTTISNNQATGASSGAIRNIGVLTITGSNLSSNQAGTSTRAPTVLQGGAIWSGAAPNGAASALTITDSVLANNTLATDRISNGGALVNDTNSTATLTRVTITGNMSYEGGAILNNEAKLTINQSTLRGNTAFFGAAIYNETFRPVANPSTTLILSQSTISGNIATATNCPTNVTGGVPCGLGGGIQAENSTTLLINSTISGNMAATNGGGIYNLRDGAGLTVNANLTAINTTIANNLSGQGGGLTSNGTSTFGNTIIADNTATNRLYPNCLNTVEAVVMSNGNNLDDDNGCRFTAASDRHGDPHLGPLADNGGPTQTRALLAGSLAIDAGNNTTCSDVAVGGVDQRGLIRPQGAMCDIGALELQNTPDPVPTLSSVSPPSGSTNGGATVTIIGTNFVTGASVSFGGALASVVTVNRGSIVVVSPSHATGTVDLIVTNPKQSPGTTGATLSQAFTFVDVAPPKHTAKATVAGDVPISVPIPSPPMAMRAASTPDALPVRR